MSNSIGNLMFESEKDREEIRIGKLVFMVEVN
jgi:hypothetical protein